MKIFTVLGNFSSKIGALQDVSLPEGPVIYLKPDSALLKGSKPFFIPDNLGEIRYCAELVVRICRLGKSIPTRFAHRYYDAVTVGVNFIASDLLKKLRTNGLPWDKATGFDASAALGEWVSKEKFYNVQAIHFHLNVNDAVSQESCSSDMGYTVDELISSISMYDTLKTGDLLYTGCPVDLMPAHIEDHISGFLEDRKVLDFNLK